MTTTRRPDAAAARDALALQRLHELRQKGPDQTPDSSADLKILFPAEYVARLMQWDTARLVQAVKQGLIEPSYLTFTKDSSYLWTLPAMRRVLEAVHGFKHGALSAGNEPTSARKFAEYSNLHAAGRELSGSALSGADIT